ncbi:hypothetical protein FOCC_FOCC007740 [Frankliniella occidentalis]|nr:hypothetical protein FOCC_FOCC007740 [Frankliniella occidentalis]
MDGWMGGMGVIKIEIVMRLGERIVFLYCTFVADDLLPLPVPADSSDQSTQAASWWQSPADLGADNPNVFSSTHGLVQTHPLLGSGPALGPGPSPSPLPGLDPLASLNVVRKAGPQPALPGAPPAPPQPPRKIDAPKKGLIELERNPSLSSPEECARACREGEPPRTCYYHFTVELYTVLGAACQVCVPNATNTVWSHCQCVLADGVERGILSRGTQYSDGVPFVTQCPIQQGNTFRYQMEAGNEGTHFWHAHSGLQKMDGIYGSIVVRQPPSQDPNSHLYDFDLTTHDAKTGFRTNTPLEIFTMTPGRRYRFRMINSLASVCPVQLTVQGHALTVIATDGEPVHPMPVDTVISFSGERYDFVITADQPVGAYWMQVRGLGECGEARAQQLAIVRYARGPYQPRTTAPTYDVGLPQGIVLNPLDAICNSDRTDAVCVNQLKNAKTVDEGILQERPDVKIFLPFRFLFYTPEEVFEPHTYNRFLAAPGGDHVISLIDGISFVFPPAPPLSQVRDIDPALFCNGDSRPFDCGANCMCVHKVDIPLHAVVEVVVVDEVAPSGDHVISLVDEISYQSPPAPPLSQIEDISPDQFCNGDNKPADCGTNCMCTHKVDIPLNAVVEVVLVDEVQQPNLSHPFHLHGYAFNVIGMGRSPDKNVKKINLKHALDLDRRGLLHRQFNLPPSKDTIAVPNNGYVVFRFRADNPGYWLFHCHFLFHIVIGMNLVVHVGTHADLPPVPPNFPRCGNFLPPIEYN